MCKELIQVNISDIAGIRDAIEDYISENIDSINWDWANDIIKQKYETSERDGDNVRILVDTLVKDKLNKWSAWRGFIRMLGIEPPYDSNTALCNYYHRCQTIFEEILAAYQPGTLSGRFSVEVTEVDNYSICIYYELPMKEKTFSEWRRERGYKSKDKLYIDIVEDPEEGEEPDDTQERAREAQTELEDDFYKYCEYCNYTPMMDED